MGGTTMQPQVGMGFGGFNSQYDRPQSVEATQVNPATSITNTRQDLSHPKNSVLDDEIEGAQRSTENVRRETSAVGCAVAPFLP